MENKNIDSLTPETFERKLPFPYQAMQLIVTLLRNKAITQEETEILNSVVLDYLNVRAHCLYGDEL